jgi:HSP20 family protein
MAELPLRTGCLDWPPKGSYFDAKPMRVEEIEDDDALVIRAELPGIDYRKDLDVRVRGHVLEIRAERPASTLENDAGARRSEFQYGRFWRVVSLPRAARESEVTASYGDGILEVRVPLDEVRQAEGTRIAVQARHDEAR